MNGVEVALGNSCPAAQSVYVKISTTKVESFEWLCVCVRIHVILYNETMLEGMSPREKRVKGAKRGVVSVAGGRVVALTTPLRSPQRTVGSASLVSF